MPAATPSHSDLTKIIAQLQNNLTQNNLQSSFSLLTKAKLALLHHNALVPSPSTGSQLLALAQQILELGALTSIRMQDPAAFTRYVQQLAPFYEIPSEAQADIARIYAGQRSKVTGLYLLLLLSQGDYAGFHTVLEGLETAYAERLRKGTGKQRPIEEDEFIQYPVRLESWLMEGSYDRVWEETKSERVPCEEFAIFSEILIGTIRDEVASCSEKAYTLIPVANAKNLLFLDSEGSVMEFGQTKGWQVEDGKVLFPEQVTGTSGSREDNVLEMSESVIENTLGYARKLETIV